MTGGEDADVNAGPAGVFLGGNEVDVAFAEGGGDVVTGGGVAGDLDGDFWAEPQAGAGL